MGDTAWVLLELKSAGGERAVGAAGGPGRQWLSDAGWCRGGARSEGGEGRRQGGGGCRAGPNTKRVDEGGEEAVSPGCGNVEGLGESVALVGRRCCLRPRSVRRS